MIVLFVFNFQNWKFVVVCSVVGKVKLLLFVYGQQKVVDVVVIFIVCGMFEFQFMLFVVLKLFVECGIFDQGIYEGWVGVVNSMYGDNFVFQCDEVVCLVLFVVMMLMIVVEDCGFVLGLMIGFDLVVVVVVFGLKLIDVLVMFVIVGYVVFGNWLQKFCKFMFDVLMFVQ